MLCIVSCNLKNVLDAISFILSFQHATINCIPCLWYLVFSVNDQFERGNCYDFKGLPK